jgi:hypothetical protein
VVLDKAVAQEAQLVPHKYLIQPLPQVEQGRVAEPAARVAVVLLEPVVLTQEPQVVAVAQA